MELYQAHLSDCISHVPSTIFLLGEGTSCTMEVTWPSYIMREEIQSEGMKTKQIQLGVGGEKGIWCFHSINSPSWYPTELLP
ncbi:hypothetical protein UY3_05981 [Chelonia mydas]|uniref:Uncharacterized protein n=1 Tax=Chelonia mydas TaxID=8469 RepID=M7BM82_CHEMY|nr:hypothetical protein UY3_05981 [Chelonia mydas]